MKTLVIAFLAAAALCQVTRAFLIPGVHIPSLDPVKNAIHLQTDTLDLVIQKKIFEKLGIKTLGGDGIVVDVTRLPKVKAISENDVSFTLFERSNPTAGIAITASTAAKVDTSLGVVFIIHGWHERRERYWYAELTKEIFKKEAVNIIQVDWHVLASKIYAEAAASTQGVGIVVGNLIVAINKLGISLERIHVIGHSMGAQITSAACRRVTEVTGRKVGRATALDAAGPLFEYPRGLLVHKISKTDAVVVDAIHTDAGGLGCKEPIGTVDFYPNGGHGYQPGCPAVFNPFGKDDEGRGEYMFCSHHRSFMYYIATVNNEGLEGVECDDWIKFKAGLCNNNRRVKMGHKLPTHEQPTGNFYLKTGRNYPYVGSAANSHHFEISPEGF